MLQFTTLAGLLALAAVAVASPTDADSIQWESYKAAHGKRYPTAEEETRRMQIFLRNVRMVEEHNKLYEKGLSSYALGIHHLSDMEPSELGGLRLGDGGKFCKSKTFEDEDLSDAPAEVDWRKKGAVTAVKNQENCGSCYAFSAVGAVEGAHYIATKQLVSLSEQQIVDCDRIDHGCRGGWMSDVFHYIIENKGIDTEASYPYKSYPFNSARGPTVCHFSNKTIGATISKCGVIQQSEKALQKAVYKVGPISVAISVTAAFHNYKHGIFDNEYCNKYTVNHGVLIVGYGTENGTDYWIVKNSWGEKWGDHGYIRMKRGSNLCHIADYAVAAYV